MVRLKLKIFSCFIIFFIELAPIYAESVKLVHWWDEYFPPRTKKSIFSYQGEGLRSLQYQDVNDDQVYNDALVWFSFSMETPLNPPVGCLPDSKSNHNYRIERPSAKFYGGVVARYANVSHITELDKKGNKVPMFDHFQQASVQPTEGAVPNLYHSSSTHNTKRTSAVPGRVSWADMTVMVINCCSPGISEEFQKNKNAQTNFSSVFLWKKEDFVNGGASANTVTFDNTSRFSVDVTRFGFNVEEGRFIVQDGEQLWISKGVAVADENGNLLSKGENGINVKTLKAGVIIELYPLDSEWALYHPFVDGGYIKQLFEEIEKMEFNPKKATPEQIELYQQKSNELLTQINKMEFHAEKAEFTAHTFKDIQAVGVYFATYPFAHATTQLVFDNFQVYAAINPSEELPLPVLVGTAINSNGDTVDTQAKFIGDVTVNGGTIKVRPSDKLDVRGLIIVDEEHVGKEAEIIAVVGYKADSASEEAFFMFNREGRIIPWDGNIKNLVAYEDEELVADGEAALLQKIKLAPERSVQIFPVFLGNLRNNKTFEDNILLGCERPFTVTGQINELASGLLRFFFGYRLIKEEILVFGDKSINVAVQE